MKESDIMRSVQLAMTQEGARLFRNNVGLFKTDDDRKVMTGLCVGSSDLIGWYKGRFLAVEVKTKKGRLTKDQQNFLDQVNKAGGIGFVARSAWEAVGKLRERR